jgi:hypothetical protein
VGTAIIRREGLGNELLDRDSIERDSIALLSRRAAG